MFSAAACGVVAYAANQLGVFAETAKLLGRDAADGAASAAQQPDAAAGATPPDLEAC